MRKLIFGSLCLAALLVAAAPAVRALTLGTQIPVPHESPNGLAWDGTYFWTSDWYADTIYKLDPSDGSIVDQFSSPGSEPAGLFFDGTSLWHIDGFGILYELDPSDGSVISSRATPDSSPRGLGFDGQRFWTADFDDYTIYQFDPDGSPVHSFGFAGNRPSGTEWVAGSIWVTDQQTNMMYVFDVFDGSVLDSFTVSGATGYRALTWDGTHMWTLGYTAGGFVIGAIVPEPSTALLLATGLAALALRRRISA